MRSDLDAPRIGYVVKVYPRFSETFIVTEILARERAGEDIEVIALRHSDDPRFHPELAKVAAPVTFLPRPARPSGVWEHLRSAAENPILARTIAQHLPELLSADVDDAVQAVALAAHVMRSGITHLHAHFATSATTVARLASLLSAVPYSFTAHAKDLFHESVDQDSLRTKVADAAYVATVSAFNVRFLRLLAPAHEERIHLVPNMIEIDRFRYRAPQPHDADTALRIVAVGRMVEKKGFAVLIDAVAALHAEGLPVALTLAGGGELAAELAQRVSAVGISHLVEMPGPIPQDRVSELLRNADVFVAPCVIGQDGNADGLPTVLLEAMSTGVPCVSTRVTGIPEVIIDRTTGLLCTPGDVDELTAALRSIAHQDVDTVALSRAARALVEQRHDARRSAARHSELMTVDAVTPDLVGSIAEAVG